MSWRAAPGEQIASGRLRVDAAKAIAKLREYQLVDRTAWILEAIRAAVASNATFIELQGDSNDVWLSWRGEPWPVEDLPRLFDELVSPEPGASRHHVRLLAAAVNSALGANPAYIDVYAIDDNGAHRVRYTPDVLDTHDGDLEDSPLRRIKATPAAVPDGAGKGMHVHYRRRASLGVLTTFLLRSEPLELLLARSACTDIAVPLRIGADTYDRATSAIDIVRVPLGDDVEGWLAITNIPIRDDTRMSVAERGVLLETRAVETGLRAAYIPVRVFVDAPRMPTNASRSEVRADVHPVSTAVRRVPELMPQAIKKLVEKCSVAQLDARARVAALQFLTDAIAGHDWAMRAPEIDGPLRQLAELPLVRDAAGIPRPMCWGWSGLVHTDAEPLDPELAPWLSRVLWAPLFDPVRALAAYANPMAMRLHLKNANRERRAEKKFYKHAKREARVLDRRTPRLRYTLGTPVANSCIPDGMFDGLAGEVCVYANRRGGSLTLLLSGREIETVEFDSAIGFAAVIDSAHLKPANRYRGIERDGEYARVEQAMRAGVIRAIESITRSLAEDAPLVRHGLALARELSRPLSLTFATAKVWRSTNGLLSIDDLRKHPVIAIVPPWSTVSSLPSRPILHVDPTEAQLLARYVKSRFISYEPHLLGARLEPRELAERVVESHALGLSEDDLVIAIRPAMRARLRLLHRGVELASADCFSMLRPSDITIDCDRIVPTDDWSGIVDDAGLRTRDLTSIERALAREAVRAITGARSPNLVGEDAVELTSPLGRWLCDSLVEHADPIELLGEELVTALRVRPLFRLLGESQPHSIDELAVRFPDTITYVTSPTDPVEGFTVLVADAQVVRLIAKLAQRESRDVAGELVERRMQIARDLRLGMHRAKPRVPLEVAGTHVEIASTLGWGVVGVGRDVLEIQVLVESRPFLTITRPDEVPLAAMIELSDLSSVDAKFERLREGVEDSLVSVVRNKTPDLIRAIADAYPDALVEPGPRRSLLARYLARDQIAPYVRDALARTIVFPTVQRGKTTILEARGGGTIVPTCAWHGEWLAADGDAHRLDHPIIYTGASAELDAILSALCTSVDVTRDVENLQAQRRMTRGLLPTPKVTGADPELVFPISVLGPAYRHLGPGEIALTSETDAAILVHANGELRARMPIECTPAILLAVEAADLVNNQVAVDLKIATHARMMAVELAKYVLAKRTADSLPPAVRASLRAAVLAGKLADLRDVPLFETTNGTWIDLATVQAQRELFSNLWCVLAPTTDTPLDERRIVLVLPFAHQTLANEHGIPIVDASRELALDARTRRNMAKPLLESLAIEDDGVLARVELPGDGVGSPRGVVAVLSPNAAARRKLRLSRRMHPFEPVDDPCRWPTLAVIDDERFTPDRTWESVAKDEVLKQAIDAVHKASNDALRQIAQPPANALVSIRVSSWTFDTIDLLRDRDIQVRGTLWLVGPPLPPLSPQIRVVHPSGEDQFVPLHGPNLAGTIYVCVTKSWPYQKLLEEICQNTHARLVRELVLTRSTRDLDLTAAHVAWAIALGRITPDDAKRIELKCFRPAPLDAAAASALFMASDPVVVVPPESKFEGPCFVDDGSETARVVRTILGSRMRNPTQRMRPDTVEPPPPVVVKHPLQAFVDRLHGRISALGVPVARWRIVDDRNEPIAAFSEDQVLELAADNKQLLAIAAAVMANTAWSADTLDAFAAHCITVLNVALTSITDAAEARAIGKLLG